MLKSSLSKVQQEAMTEVFNRWKLDYFTGDAKYEFATKDGFMGLFPAKDEEPLQDEFGYIISSVAMNEKGRVVFYRDYGNERYEVEASPNPYYVTMTDAFFSGWGPARKKNNKLVIECCSADEADIVADNARRRGDQRYIKIVRVRPELRNSRAYTQRHCRIGYERWFRAGGF